MSRLPDPSQAELIANENWLVADKVNLKHLLALHDAPFFVGELCDKLASLCIEDIACRRIGIVSIQREGDPTGLIANRQTGLLFWRHDGGVKDMQVAVMTVGHPD